MKLTPNRSDRRGRDEGRGLGTCAELPRTGRRSKAAGRWGNLVALQRKVGPLHINLSTK